MLHTNQIENQECYSNKSLTSSRRIVLIVVSTMVIIITKGIHFYIIECHQMMNCDFLEIGIAYNFEFFNTDCEIK